MIIASEKRKTNIAEYLLYMWHIEDLIRANNLDIDLIKKNIIDRYNLSPEKAREMTEWYESLIDMMRREGVEKSGHLQMNRNIISELARLHQTLLADPAFPEYSKEFYNTLPFIVELRAKAGDAKAGEIETCFNALYGLLMLKLQGKEISPETAKAAETISHFLATLAHDFALDEKDQLFKHNND
ncbi:MAG: DUF4924 family protein [Muribaculaceae bacterium]|nr:DUF4924 family protein [Muribaculaceae bacterium]